MTIWSTDTGPAPGVDKVRHGELPAPVFPLRPLMCAECQAKLARGESAICGCVLSQPVIS